VDVDARDDLEQTALLKAAGVPWLHEQPAVRALLDAGANPNLSDNGGDTALIVAARMNQATTVQLLLSRGARPQIRNKKGENALDAATTRDAGATDAETMRNKSEIIRLLQPKRKAPEQENQPKGRAPLGWAVAGGLEAALLSVCAIKRRRELGTG